MEERIYLFHLLDGATMLDERYFSDNELQERQQELERHVKDIE